MKGDFTGCVLGVLISLLAIYDSKVSSSPAISLPPSSRSEAPSPVIQEILSPVQPIVSLEHISPISMPPSMAFQPKHITHGKRSASHPSSSVLPNFKIKRRPLAPPPSFDGFELNPSTSPAPMPTPKDTGYAPLPSHLPPHVAGPKSSRASVHPPMHASKKKRSHGLPSSHSQGHFPPPVLQPPFSSSSGEVSAAPRPAPTDYIIWQIYSPISSPPPQSKRALPPPPPNHDCGAMMCEPPLTNPCPGSPCICVLPIKVGLRLNVALYVFFPLVSKFAEEIAMGVSMKQSQVRIMGANSASEDPEKTDVLIDLVPSKKSFDNTTAFLAFEKFWKKQVSIRASYFGDYVVLYVSYPGLPPSPPTSTYLNGEAYSNSNNGSRIHPLGVGVRKIKKKLGGSLMAIIVMSSMMGLILIIGTAWLLLIRNRKLSIFSPNFRSSQKPFAKSSGTPVRAKSGSSSISASLNSSIAAYVGSAKTFKLAEMERATNRFDDSGVIGEGGFGRVFKGVLQDGTNVAVKVLKRDDRQGEREFLAEVEILSRLHHRNLVKLIGICPDESVRCLVYELVPNGSVESHLHGVDRETAPLDWNARVKIALGAARGLAYLHEDSSPRVIHRDFKSSNILLEHDFTPKVSDFGLARSALDEGKEHISTRVMGTFGYVDPEYAMTGHLLVKSDVYSYGVVLIELLTGRKPVDMSQPPGQENLVAWTRSLLTNMKDLQAIIDRDLRTNYPQSSVAKVAAIASMCVQPEVSQRPSMSEVVQALKLVYDDSGERRQSESDEMSMRDVETGVSVELNRERSNLDVLCASSRFGGDALGSFRLYSSSGPLRTCRSMLFWQRVRGLGLGSSSEHGFGHRFWLRRHRCERWS